MSQPDQPGPEFVPAAGTNPYARPGGDPLVDDVVSPDAVAPSYPPASAPPYPPSSAPSYPPSAPSYPPTPSAPAAAPSVYPPPVPPLSSYPPPTASTPAAYPPPPYPPVEAVPAPAKKRSVGRAVAIIVCAVVLIVGAVGFFALGRGGDADSTKFVDSLESGDFDTAYAMMAPQLQAKMDASTLAAQVAPLGLSTSCTTAWTSLSATTGQSSTKEAVGTLTCPNAAAPSFDVHLTWAKQGAVYQLTGITIQG